MVAKPNDIEAIYNAALQKGSEAQRSAYLDAVCGDDDALRARVEALLKAHEQAGDFLEVPALEPDVTVEESPLIESPGTRIGRYKLLEKIGEGGMAAVYMAEQDKPLRRRVALKIIKLGMDTKQVIARFEVERQALAMMDHPNIAKVLDAGATETGRPYFVMELVKGVSITEYCDKNKLSTRERLDLFVQVCSAVQHAHQKGIIHRDIKPTNVMITLHDGKPVPKVIDFGIAKATSQRLTEKTLFTRYAQLIGTPEYMSPEQAEMSGLDVDTRSDIYSLGVLLYELLTGTTPFERKQLLSAAYDEIRRIICETEPLKPSTRLSSLGDALSDVAKHRHVQPDQLCKMVRGDLDWVVMKALEKDRTRRYETANEFARDIGRHLGDEPVVAGPPGVMYRLSKFVRRNRALVTATAAVAVALVVGFIATTMMWFRAEGLRVQAEQAEELLRYFLAKQAPDKVATARAQPEQAEELVSKAVEEKGKILAFDDFDGMLSLDWDILHPDPSRYSLTRKPGTLTITTQQGDFVVSSNDYKNLFLIDCPARAGEDFQITTCISSFKPMDNWDQAGLICWNDDDNYLKFVYEWASIWESPSIFRGRMFTVLVETEGGFETVRFPAVQALEKVWLRVTKRGNRYAFSTSVDGETFLLRKSPIWDGTDLFKDELPWDDGSVKRVGIFAQNGRGREAEIDASFDFFEVRAVSARAEAAKAMAQLSQMEK